MHNCLRTSLCDRLGIALPILQAPMAGWTTSELVAAVGEAGGLGFLPTARTSVEGFQALLDDLGSKTDQPFGVNFLLAPPEPAPSDVQAVQDVLDELRRELGLPPGPRELRLPGTVLQDQHEIALAARVPVVSYAMGNPGPLAERAHSAGAFVLVMVTSVEEAIEAEAAGADAIIAQGIEAGGHRSTFRVGTELDLPQVGTFALVPQVVDAVSVPVIAAGGVMDGRGIVAALALGAQGVQMGTRFLMAHESGAYPAYRRWIAHGEETSTHITRLLTGRPARAFRNQILRALESSGIEPLPWPYQALAADDIYRHAVQHGSADAMALLAGQGLRLASSERGAADIVEELAREASELLDRLGEGC